VGADRAVTLANLPTKSHERVFFERVPLAADARAEIKFTDPWDYSVLAEAVEAWGFRASQHRAEHLDRGETAQLWLETEYRPVVAMLREADLIHGSTDAEAYLRVTEERYRLLRTHSWSDDVLERLISAGKKTRRR
jgi:hypothetical protein